MVKFIGRKSSKKDIAPTKSVSQFYIKDAITENSYQPRKPKYASDRAPKATIPYITPYPGGSG